MKRILCWSSAVAMTFAIALTGCESGGEGDAGQGVPKTGYVPLNAPPGAPKVTADMTTIGNKPTPVKKAASAEPEKASEPAPAK